MKENEIFWQEKSLQQADKILKKLSKSDFFISLREPGWR